MKSRYPKCPFFRAMDVNRIECEGESKIGFPSETATERFLSTRCAGNWELCSIAQMLNQHYLGDDDRIAKNPSEVGKILRELRGDKKLKDVADALGISLTVLFYYESGERVPRADVQEKIAKYYGKSVNDIFYK